MWKIRLALWSLLALVAQVSLVLCLTATVCGPGPHNLSSQTGLDIYQKQGKQFELTRTDRPRSGGWTLTYLSAVENEQKAKFRRYSYSTVYSITVKRLFPLFQGISLRYDVQVDNNSTITRHAVFNLWEKPMLRWSTTEGHINFTVYEGQNLTGLCFNITAGKPEPTVEVVKVLNNRPSADYVVASHKYKPDQTFGCLNFLRLSLTDSGDYGVIARNCLPPSSPALRFRVWVLQGAPPFVRIESVQSGKSKVTTHAEGISVVVGDDVRIMYHVSGNPKPIVTWKHNGQNLNTSHRVEYNSTHFHITKFEASDSGNYVVVLTNPLGESSSRILHLRTQVADPTLLPTDKSNGDVKQNSLAQTTVHPTTTPIVPTILNNTSCCHGSSEDNSDSSLAWWGVLLIVLFIIACVCLAVLLIYYNREKLLTFMREHIRKKDHIRSPSVHWHVSYQDTRPRDDWGVHDEDNDGSHDDPLSLTSYETFKRGSSSQKRNNVYDKVESNNADNLQETIPEHNESGEEETKFTTDLPDVVQGSVDALPANPEMADQTDQSFQYENQGVANRDHSAINHLAVNCSEKYEHEADAVNGMSEMQSPSTDNKEGSQDEEEAPENVVYSSIIHSQSLTSSMPGNTATASHKTEDVYAEIRKDSKKEKKQLNYVELDLSALQQRYK